MKKVLFTAAHSGFALARVPLGGGAAVCEHLIREWRRTKPFDLEVLGPSLLGKSAPHDKDLVRYSELEYARFCFAFEARATEMILAHGPQNTVVLSNDISEGPNFQKLAAAGYSLYTLYHVDVVDYFSQIYLKSCIKPEHTTALYRTMRQAGISGLLPKVLQLIWKKQEDSVRFSKGLIVPSMRMKEVLMRCYPEARPERIHVLPWGSWSDETITESEIAKEKESLKNSFPMPADSWILLMLSRISPEKGQDRLLKALALWEKEPDFPREGVSVFIAGEYAYMKGKKFEQELKKLAKQLKKSRVYFVGYAAEARKKALFELADLYVFPSRHESYGLTLMEALRAGKPVLATPSYGAQEVFQPEFGEMAANGSESVIVKDMAEGLKRLLRDRSLLKEKGSHAAVWTKTQDFSATAAKLAQRVVS